MDNNNPQPPVNTALNNQPLPIENNAGDNNQTVSSQTQTTTNGNQNVNELDNIELKIEDVLVPVPSLKTTEDEEEISDEDRELRQKVEAQTAPLREDLRKTQRVNELNSFLSTETGKHFAKYRSQLEQHVHNPAFNGLKMQNVVFAILGENTLRIGAAMEREAIKANKPHQPVGNVSRQIKQPAKPFSQMTDAEFDEFNRQNGIRL